MGKWGKLQVMQEVHVVFRIFRENTFLFYFLTGNKYTAIKDERLSNIRKNNVPEVTELWRYWIMTILADVRN